MKGRKRDWAGVTQGKLTVLKEAGRDTEGGVLWECLCTCGVSCFKSNKTLANGTKSCSVKCGVSESNALRTVHGMWKTKEYKAWVSMKQRCLNASHTKFDRYGGRGIGLAPEWENDFAQFLADVGCAPAKSATLDRIDNNRGYEKGNVRWATRKQQSNNREVTLRAIVDGVELTLSEIAERYNAPYHAVFGRFKRGLTGMDLVTTQTVGRKPKQK